MTRKGDAAPVALVTGASRGIGKALCRDLAGAGYDVVCCARSSQASEGPTAAGRRPVLPGTVEETAALVEAAGRRAMAVGIDVRDEEAVAALAERVYAEWGRCDLLVNNAAVAPPRPALDDKASRFRMAVDVNLIGPFYFCYYLGRRMREAGEGRIVNISSVVSRHPEFGRASYTASKRGLEGLGEVLAHELRGSVAVNCIQLEVMVWSEGFEATLPKDTDFSNFEDPVVMSDAVLWLAEQPIAYTGEILTIGELRERGVVRPPTRISG